MCRCAARLVAAIDRREALALLPLGDDEARDLLAGVPAERRDDCWWLVRRDGTPIPGDAGGAVELLAEIGLTRPLGTALRILRLSPALDAFDRLVSRHRARLGRLVPDGPAPRRFP